jgi:transposase
MRRMRSIGRHCFVFLRAFRLFPRSARTRVRLIRERKSETLLPWLERAKGCPYEELQRFAQGLERELPAVQAALTEPWSTGQVEGQITRLKLLKRQMYGRANLDLLRLRVLHVA